MGFLDNLENSLKNLESSDERDPGGQARQAEERARAREAAPWAERLRSSDYTKRLLDEAALEGHRIRTKIYMAWLDSTLRLEARGRRLELRPTATGIIADFTEPDGSSSSQPVDLHGDPGELLANWLHTHQTQQKGE